LLVNFIGTLGFSIVLPFLVFLVTRFGGNALIYGLVGAAYPAFQLLGAPILGAWSDRYGRRPVLLLSQTGTLLSWVIFAAALFMPATALLSVASPTWGTFTLTLPLVTIFIARALDGLTGGNISVANAYLADITAESDRSRNFGRMGVSSNLGFIFGPALASLLGALGSGEVLPVFAALLISLVATVLIAVALPESHRRVTCDGPDRQGVRRALGQEPVDCTDVPDAQRVGLSTVVRQFRLRRMLTLYLLIFLGFSLFYVAFPVRAARDLSWTVGETGLFFSVLSLMMVLVQGPLLSRLSRVIPEGTLILSGSALLAVNFLLLTSGSTTVIYAAAVLFALGNGTMWPSVQAVLSKVAGPEYQGAAQGFAGAAGSLASVLGLLVGGVLYESVGVATFVFAAAMMVAVSALAAAWIPRVRQSAP
jgi:MFS family permease